MVEVLTTCIAMGIEATSSTTQMPMALSTLTWLRRRVMRMMEVAKRATPRRVIVMRN
jgi:hypothetical protein